MEEKKSDRKEGENRCAGIKEMTESKHAQEEKTKKRRGETGTVEQKLNLRCRFVSRMLTNLTKAAAAASACHSSSGLLSSVEVPQ